MLYALIAVASIYVVFTLYRALKLTAKLGAKGETTDFFDIALIVFKDIYKLCMLPKVAFKAFRKSKQPA